MERFPFIITDKPTLWDKLGGIRWQEVLGYVSKMPLGTAGNLSISKQGKPKSREQLGYYYGVILPHATKELQRDEKTRMVFFIESAKVAGTKRIEIPTTENGVDMMLKTVYAQYSGTYMDKAEMDMETCARFEDWCIHWLAQHKEIFVPPAQK